MTLLNITPAQVAKMQQAAAGGESLSSIARRFGISRNSVTRYIRETRHVGPPAKSSARTIRSVIRKCPGCPMLFQIRSDGRKYCSEQCRADMVERENKLFVEEVRWIAGTNTWHNVAVRMGYKNVRTLARRLDSLGASDLARQAELMGVPREYGRAA